VRIYLDFNASTPIAPVVADAMRPFLDQHCENPSSGRWTGRPARDSVERARGEIASLLDYAADKMLLARGGTESAFLAAGLDAACRLAESDPCGDRVLALRDRSWHTLCDSFGDRVVLNGHPTDRLPNTLSIAFPGRFGDEVVRRLEHYV